MTDYYLLNVSSLPDPAEDDTALDGIPLWRRKKILKYIRCCDRRLSLGAWRLMEKALEQHGFSADGVIIGKNGKPECAGIYFNLSHSDEMVLCVVSDRPVGCDIEKITAAPMEIAEHFFSHKERAYISASNSVTESDRRFFKLWTIKESYMKMTGEGMSLSPIRIEADPEDNSIRRDGVLVSCRLSVSVFDGYATAVCTGRGGSL